ncbi:MAG TPA: TauD/TfdA family dioxygenase [Pyrinomonadaceae bacterium]|nr:TauD/TfdA family dioxygenase [Pyrinomonadaceae bacterium]
MSNPEPESLSGSMLKSVRRQRLNISRKDLVTTGSLRPGQALPLLVEPRFDGVSLAEWAGRERALIERHLRESGGILFRGFGIDSPAALEAILAAVELPRMHYMEGATPRTELGAQVYTSTEYPPEHSIALHNELNYVMTWPMRVLFCCGVPSETQGETPIADVRKVWRRLSEPVRRAFAERGWMLVRNFGDGLSLKWETTFRTSERAEVEEYCRRSHISYEWKGEGRLRTRQVRPAVRRHPHTGEEVWFNHVAFWHVSSLEPSVREAFLREFAVEDLPYNTYYGDGGVIEDEVVEEIRQAYDAETVAFRWERGDLLLLDNMLVAHGRRPYTGARKVYVAMGEPFSDMRPAGD